MKIYILIIKVMFINFIFVSDAFAYFDPGTGSFIVQSILALLATIAASLSVTYLNIKNFIKKIFKKKVNKKIKTKIK